MTDLSEALLEAHVRHDLQRLTGAGLQVTINEGVSATFRWLEGVTLDDVATRDQILAVIQHYVIELRVSGGITELAGEMSNVVFSSESAKGTRVDEVLSPEGYEDFADKIAELGNVHRELVRYVTRSAAFRTLVSRVLVRTLADSFLRAGGTLGPRVRALVGTVGERLFPGFESRFGAALTQYVEARVESLSGAGDPRLLELLDREWLRRMADEIWDEISSKPVADAALVITAQDLEDFVVLGYEFWLKFRKTRYFRAVSTEVVERLFQKYGDENVLSVITDMGVTEDMIARELGTFVPPLLQRAGETGFLEQQLRTHLEAFYRSSTVADLLARRDG
jgi:hypothetical protein